MFKRKPIVVVLGACLLQACAVPSAQQEIAMQPVLQVRHSSDQAAATYYRLGKYHQERGDLDLALAAYTRSIELDRRHLEARNAIASIFSEQGRLDEAMSLLVQVVTDYPGVAHPYNNLGYVYFMQGNFKAAETNLERALMLDPKNERARNNLSAVRAAMASDSQGVIAARPAVALRETRSMTPPGETLVREEGDAVAVNNAPSLATRPAPKSTEVVTSSGPAPFSDEAGVLNQASATQTRLEVVQVVPHVFELKLKAPIAPKLNQFPEAGKIVARPTTAPASAAPSKTSRLEVANGNGVTGMARRIRSVLGQQGIAVSRLTNEVPYKQQNTKIQYRAGYEQEAEALKRALRGFAAMVPVSTLAGNSHIRLVLGKDAIEQLALIEGSGNPVHLALNETPN